MKAPFTDEQVKKLNEYQKLGQFHPYTCCGRTENTPHCKRQASYDLLAEKEKEYLEMGTGWLLKELKEKHPDLYEKRFKNSIFSGFELARTLACAEVPFDNDNEGIMVATNEGWNCPCGGYQQLWAHDLPEGEKEETSNMEETKNTDPK